MIARGTVTPIALLSVSAAAIAAVSYGCSLVLAHVLVPAQFAAFAGATALVTTAGVASSALVPLPLAAALRQPDVTADQRRDALTFAAVAALVGGVVTALLVAGPALSLGDPAVTVAVPVAVVALFAVAPIWGLLLGRRRYGRYAALTLLEVLARLLFTAVAVAAGAGAAGAVGGYVGGAAAVLALAGAAVLRGTAGAEWRRVAAQSHRWREVGAVATVQVVLAAMAALDAVVVAAAGWRPVEAAAYLAVATLVKAPLYLAVASATISFPDARSSAAPPERVVGDALRGFARLTVPVVIVVATVPVALAGLVLPRGYRSALDLLPWLAAAAGGTATVTVLAMLLLALRERAALGAVLASGAGLLTVAVAVAAPAGPMALARATAVAALMAALVAAASAYRSAPRFFAGAMPAPAAVVRAAVVLVVLLVLHPYPMAWALVVTSLGVGMLLVARLGAHIRARVDDDAPPGHPHVLHLGFEDPRMPGSGGGSHRTEEINRRLAASGTRITVLTTRFPGARDRTETVGAGSVRWLHIGGLAGRGRLSRLVGYVLAAPAYARLAPGDLVVEDFFAPISSLAAPWWTPRPTVAVVQWLNAREKSREYHLPFHLVERVTTRSHRWLVAVSAGVAHRLAMANPRARVIVIGNGVDERCRGVEIAERGADVVFVGRLEIAQKGLDLLLDAWAQVAPRIEGDLVLAGTGPDEAALRTRVTDLGIDGRVRFAGWVAGREKFTLVAGAALAVVPSRFETFGIVAAEALSVGTAVVAYDIDCLREVIPPRCGATVPLTGVHGTDVAALAGALVAAHGDSALRDRARAQAASYADAHDWDALAALQEAVYHAALHSPSGSAPESCADVCTDNPGADSRVTPRTLSSEER